jgi:hypothetical protein
MLKSKYWGTALTDGYSSTEFFLPARHTWSLSLNLLVFLSTLDLPFVYRMMVIITGHKYEGGTV